MSEGVGGRLEKKADKREVDLRDWLSRPWVKWALIFGFWTFFGALIGMEGYAQRRLSGAEPPLARLLVPPLTWAYAWAFFTPLILWLRRSFRFDRGQRIRSAAVHLPASLMFAFIGSVVFIFISQAIGNAPPNAPPLLWRSLRLFIAWLHLDPWLYWIILALGYVGEHYQVSRQRELQASQLETQLAEARLDALEMQLQPHFLFNALHTIAVLVRTQKNAQAVRVVTGLGELLRRVLDTAGTQVVPLKQELEFIERYLEIEQIRFGERLKIDMRIQPETLDARVPNLILQPLVENAIRHGIAPRVSAGHLEIEASRVGDQLRLSVSDDGPGLRENNGRSSSSGLGLSATRERLAQMYGAESSFEVRNGEGGGVTAELRIPYQLAAEELQREAIRVGED